MVSLRRLSLFLFLTGLLIVIFAAPAARAQAPATQPAQPALPATPLDPALVSAVDDYWHYATIARYDLANQNAEKILAAQDRPVEVLKGFEKVAADRKERGNLDQWLLRWQGIAELKDSTSKIIALLNQGRSTRRADLSYIQENIRMLSSTERGYSLALARLRESGELAVPLMIDQLRDPAQRPAYPALQRGLRDLGRMALNPLVAATEMTDADTLIKVIDALGQIGYDASIPYLLRLAKAKELPDAVHDAARRALLEMGAGDPAHRNAAEAFYDLGEKFYYDTAAITADPRNPVAFVWYWDQSMGLRKKDVAPAIFNEIMAMRACEYSLKLDPMRGAAVSLWLAANYKREVELPVGQSDPTRAPAGPDAHYYGVASGAQYVNQVLARAVKDRNAGVALKAIKSLQTIAGESNLFSGTTGQPIADALNYPDRLVRFEAAFAVAEALPQKSFMGQDRVVPILAEAVSQTGKPNVLLVLPSLEMVNAVTAILKNEYGVVGATTADAAVNESARLASIDLIVLTEELGADQIDRMFALSSQTARLEAAAKLIITKTSASRYAAATINNPMVNITQSTEEAPFKAALAAALKRAGALTMDEKMATAYAMKAAQLLQKLAISRGQIFDLSVAEPSLLSALDDARAELVKAAGGVLGLISSRSAQLGLLTKASEEKTADDVKISLYRSLATNAKFFGNNLDADAISILLKVVESAANLEVRSAAAEARGALNLPADQAKSLIVGQSKV